MIYSDGGLAANVVHEDSSYLESAYGMMSKAFADKAPSGQGTNIWHGKALVFMFSDNELADDFVLTVYDQKDSEDLMMSGVRPLVTLDNAGRVGIVISQQNVFFELKRDLIIGMAGGFLHRLRSQTPLAPWVETGLALAIADSVHYQGNQYQSDAEIARQVRMTATENLRRNGIDAYLDSKPLFGPVCEGLVSFLIAKSPSNMAKFVDEMKDGKDWQTAMQDAYQLTPAALKSAYLQYAGNS